MRPSRRSCSRRAPPARPLLRAGRRLRRASRQPSPSPAGSTRSTTEGPSLASPATSAAAAASSSSSRRATCSTAAGAAPAARCWPRRGSSSAPRPRPTTSRGSGRGTSRRWCPSRCEGGASSGPRPRGALLVPLLPPPTLLLLRRPRRLLCPKKPRKSARPGPRQRWPPRRKNLLSFLSLLPLTTRPLPRLPRRPSQLRRRRQQQQRPPPPLPLLLSLVLLAVRLSPCTPGPRHRSSSS